MGKRFCCTEPFPGANVPEKTQLYPPLPSWTVKVKVLSITPEGKVNLSIKNAGDPHERERRTPTHDRRISRSEEPPHSKGRYAHAQPREGQVAHKTADLSFENKLKQFMQESDSKISGSRLYDQQRKGSRKKRY